MLSSFRAAEAVQLEAKAAREEREAERGRVRKALRRFSSHPNCSMVRKPRNSMNDD